ncbi:MAG TPA: GNAT family protein [Methylomirabilota bacterium]|jgi:RimJ/RimL family protein N-acetyltransferase|nr:GNAT family protein [Methylomirabilota bacterium]
MIEVAPAMSLEAGSDGSEAIGQGVVIARGKRVQLRTLVPSDLDFMGEWAEDPFLERMVGSEFLHAYKHVYDKDASFYEAVLTDPTQVVFVIVANKGWTKPVGLVRLFNIHLLEGYAFLETMITDQKAIRQGFGVEAGILITYYGVDVLGLRRIEAKVYEYNVLSMNSLKRHGFHQEGILRKAGYQGGKYWDVVVFGILREEVEEQRRKDKP